MQRETSSSAKKMRSETGDEMLTFVESDNKDLAQIFQKVDQSKIPEDMRLLWGVQMQQLATKSPKGYRWHPRFMFTSVLNSTSIRHLNVYIRVL